MVMALMAGAVILGASGVANAQLAVELKLDKKTYVSYEPMSAEVTIYNRSGRDVVLGGPAGTTWLRFQVKNYHDNLLSPGSRRVSEQPLLIKAGGRTIRTLDLSNYYPVYDYGTYRIRASVYHPTLERYYESADVTVQVADGRKIWEESVGAPVGFPGGGMRRFVLLTYRGESKTELYMRLVDEDGAVYATYSLGSVILFHRPQAVVDGNGSLNVLFLGAPQVFAHVIVGFDGQLIRREVYRAAGFTRPQLTMGEGGVVQVRGGRSERTEREAAANADASRVRSLSERPSIPGLGQ